MRHGVFPKENLWSVSHSEPRPVQPSFFLLVSCATQKFRPLTSRRLSVVQFFTSCW